MQRLFFCRSTPELLVEVDEEQIAPFCAEVHDEASMLAADGESGKSELEKKKRAKADLVRGP